MQKAQALVQSPFVAQAITTNACYWALIGGGCQKKGERLHMVGKRDRLAELLLSQSSEIGLALPPTNQAQSFTQLYHVIDPRHFWVQHESLTLDE